MLGCIKYLEEKNHIRSLINFIGTSAGSIVALFLVLGYTYVDILKFMGENFYNKNVQDMNIEEAFNIIETYGLNSGTFLHEFCKSILQFKHKDPEISFIDLAKSTGKNLVVCVSNLTKERAEYMSVDTEPHMPVLSAIRISCSIPILFTPVMYKDCYYVDGCIYDNFPIAYFKDNMLRDIIGINILSKNYQNTDNLFNYVWFILSTMMEKYYAVQDDSTKNIITINIEDISWISLADMKLIITPEIIADLVSQGYNTIKRKMEHQVDADCLTNA